MTNFVPGFVREMHAMEREGSLAVEGRTDAERSKLVHLHPLWNAGDMYEPGDVVRRGDALYRRSQPMTYPEIWPPEDVPALWDRIMYRDGIRIIPDVIPSTQPFNINDIGWWEEKLYKSLIDANVYTPEQYPIGWEVIINGNT